MKHQNVRWKQIAGGIFIALALGIYALYFLLIVWLRQMAAAEHFDPAFVNAMTALGAWTIFLANWPSALLLGFGTAWLWNSRTRVRVWCYRILMAFFLGSAALLCIFLFATSLRHVAFSSRWKVEAAAFWYAVAGLLFYWRSRKVLAKLERSGLAGESAAQKSMEEKPQFVPQRALRSETPSSFAACNILQVGVDRRTVWQFEARRDGFALKGEQSAPNGQPLPANLVRKSWQSLWQKKLNVAWLPPEQVFLRAAQFPQSTFDETLAMVELQLEKLSPLPVTQIVWSIHILPQTAEGLQTVVVMIAARELVEEFLGRLEGQGYLADRLELSMLDQLQNTPVAGDGAWIYPETAGGINTALVAWWYGGTLQHLGLISLPLGQNRAAAVKEQFTQMAWGGELEGWLTGNPRLHLVAATTVAAEWQAALREGLGEPVEVVAPLPPPELAAATAKRAAQAPAKSNLLPAEFAARYQQQFVDRLWMRGLGAVLSLYVVGVLVYLGAVQVLAFRMRSVEKDVADLGPGYTNTLQLKARYEVLRDRQELKFAALDCWKTTAERLPEGLTLQGLDFRDGKTLALNGTAPADQVTQVIDFYETMRKARLKDQPLFNKFTELSYRKDPNNTLVTWNFACELGRSETP